MNAATYTARQILRNALAVAQADLLAESFQDHPQAAEILARTRNAITAGYLAVTDEGLFTLTATGAAYLGTEG
jgi:hypothetical protein